MGGVFYFTLTQSQGANYVDGHMSNIVAKDVHHAVSVFAEQHGLVYTGLQRNGYHQFSVTFSNKDGCEIVYTVNEIPSQVG